jgi:hypothetical protein
MGQVFTLKLITRQAGGGEIVRTRRVERPELTIGRAADSDIVLPDLAVDLQHAVMRHAGPGRVAVEAVGPGDFQVNGAATRRAEFNVASHTLMAFGEYDISVEPGEEEEGEVALTVNRREQDHAPSVSVFALRAAVFGRRRMAWFYALTIFLLCLILPAAGGLYMSRLQIHPDRQWSTGPLSKSHAFLEHDCQSCHQKAFVAVRDEACLACHKAGRPAADIAALNARLRDRGSPIPTDLVADHADHDRLMRAMPPPRTPGGLVKAVFQFGFNHPSGRCASCHLEHTAPLPDKTATTAAIDASRPAIPTLMGADCAGCHSRLKERLPNTTLADTPDWGHHPDFRPLVTISAGGVQPVVRRLPVADHPREQSGLVFSHMVHLDPIGGVARQALELGAVRGYGAALGCASCHRSDKTGAGFRPIAMERDCAACHSLAFANSGGALKFLPHGDVQKVMATLTAYYGAGGPAPAGAGDPSRRRPGQFGSSGGGGSGPSAAAMGAFNAAFREGGSCYGCHAIQWGGADTLGVRVAPVHLVWRFLPNGGFDHSIPAHRGEGKGAMACVDCHKARTSDHAEDLLIPAIAKCATCHGKTTAQTPAAASADCSTCHGFHAPGTATLSPQDKLLRAIRASWEPPPTPAPAT